MMNTRNRVLGFSLVEMMIVLLVVSLLLATFLGPLSLRLEQQRRENTQLQLDEIKATLIAYVLENGHLPCPDCRNGTSGCSTAFSATPTQVQDGVEDTIPNTNDAIGCATEVGDLPWDTLGVEGVDDWNNRFTYRVALDFADRDDPADLSGTGDSDGTTGCPASSLRVSFSLCSAGDIEILRTNYATSTDDEVASQIPAIVVSHGKNGSQAFFATGPEFDNDGSDVTFFDNDYNEQEDEERFDDLLIWISPHTLKAKAVRSRMLP